MAHAPAIGRVGLNIFLLVQIRTHQGFLRVINLGRRSSQEAFKSSRVEPGRVRTCLKFHGSGRVGSGYPDPVRPGVLEVIRAVKSSEIHYSCEIEDWISSKLIVASFFYYIFFEVETDYSCAIEDFVEAHRCKLCVILRSRV